MKRILVMGNAGAGKSTFSERLAVVTGFPVYHLDQHYWQAGWHRSEKRDFIERTGALALSDHWIMDGNYEDGLAGRIARADIVILLDTNRFQCLWRVFWRTLQQRGTVRDYMAEDCPEHFSLWFVRYVWDFPNVLRPMIMGLVQEFDRKLIELGDFREHDKFLALLAAPEDDSKINW